MFSLRHAVLIVVPLVFLACSSQDWPEDLSGPDNGEPWPPPPEIPIDAGDLRNHWTGTVTSSVDGAPIEGVLVRIYHENSDGSVSEGLSELTDSKGDYHITSRSCGGSFLRASSPEWQDSERAYYTCMRWKWYYIDLVLDPVPE
jgi:hypothetical protein